MLTIIDLIDVLSFFLTTFSLGFTLGFAIGNQAKK